MIIVYVIVALGAVLVLGVAASLRIPKQYERAARGFQHAWPLANKR